MASNVPLDLVLFGWLIGAPVVLVLVDWARMRREQRRPPQARR